MQVFCPLGSGSKGNSLYLGTKETKILIDAGLSGKMIAARLGEINVDISEIEAILVTHEHTDHINGLKTLAFKMGIPVFANSETAKAIYGIYNDCPKFKIFSTNETFEFGDLEIHPFSIQHDAVDPVAFTIKCNGNKLGICTDLGFATTLVKNHLKHCDFLYLEANHQPSMVHASARPLVYKQRVLSRQGHLSNEECGDLLAEVSHEGLKHVYLAHLSSECNHPEVALKTVQDKVKNSPFRGVITIASQDAIGHVSIISAPTSSLV